MQTRIKICIHKSVLDRAFEFYLYEDFSPDGNVLYIVRFSFIENDYYYNILLGFRNKCECLEPLLVLTKMKYRIHEIASIYE